MKSLFYAENHLKRPGPRGLLPLLLTVLVGSLLSLGISLRIGQLSEQASQHEFERRALLQGSIIQDKVRSTIHVVEAVASFYAASETVEREEFRAFVRPFLSRNPGIKALEWVPRVEHADRRAYAAAARADGLDSFQITERKAQGLMVPAKDRNEYFPVYYLQPLAGNEAALGFDLASAPPRLASLEQARDTGRLVATGRITLAQEPEGQPGLSVVAPIYRKEMPLETVEERRAALQGFVAGVFLVANFFDQALAEVPDPGLDILLTDETRGAGARMLYFSSSRSREPHKEITARPEAEDGWQKEVKLSLPDLEWTLTIWPAPSLRAELENRDAWFALAVGLLVTLLLSVHLAERRATEKKMHYMAKHDPLTKLPNRRLLYQLGTYALATARRNETGLAVLFMDIDGFKAVNDTFGHRIGDRLLKDIARRLTGRLRESDVVARLGGDEFVILLTQRSDIAGAPLVADQIINTIAEPFDIEGSEIRVAASIGIAVYPDHGDDIDALLRHADNAMYRVKKGGKNGWCVYDGVRG